MKNNNNNENIITTNNNGKKIVIKCFVCKKTIWVKQNIARLDLMLTNVSTKKGVRPPSFTLYFHPKHGIEFVDSMQDYMKDLSAQIPESEKTLKIVEES